MSDIFEEKEVTQTIIKKTRVGVKCDVCGKELQNDSSFWRLSTHHHDWGNDSIDSYKHFDLCSRECINKKLDEYIENCKMSNTQEFELSQATV